MKQHFNAILICSALSVLWQVFFKIALFDRHNRHAQNICILSTAGEKCFRVVLKSEILPVQILYSGESALSNPDGHADESL